MRLNIALKQSLQGLTAVVSGGASGLGLATSKMLLNEGCKVMVCDLKKTTEFEEISNDCTFNEIDICSESDVQKSIDDFKEKFTKIDVLVNCAGIGFASKIVNVRRRKPHPLADFEKTLKVNVLGTFNMVRLCALAMLDNQPDSDGLRAVIINTSSVSAFEGQVGQVAYASSKAAVAGMTLPLARDLSRDGIRVVAILPGVWAVAAYNDYEYTPEETLLPFTYVQATRDYLKDGGLFNTRTIVGQGRSPDANGYLSDLQLGLGRLGHPSEYANLVHHIIKNPMLNAENIRLSAGARQMYL